MAIGLVTVDLSVGQIRNLCQNAERLPLRSRGDVAKYKLEAEFSGSNEPQPKGQTTDSITELPGGELCEILSDA